MCESCVWEDVLENINEGRAMLDEIEETKDSDAAADFCGGLRETFDNMADWIAENKHVTEPQVNAIDNMLAAAGRWLR